MPTLIQSARNPAFQEFRRAFSESNFRNSDCFPLEGLRLIEEALDYGLGLDAVLASSRLEQLPGTRTLTARLRASARRFFWADERLVQTASGTEHSQGLLCLFCKPTRRPLSEYIGPRTLLLVLADVQDPGNCGALARSFLAFGGQCLLTVGATADMLSPKATRSSAGATFRLALFHYRNLRDVLTAPELKGVSMLPTAPTGGILPESWPTRLPAAAIIGNEGRGLDPEILKRSPQTLSLPMDPRAQSLNAAVAGSLVLYELSRRLSVGPFLKP